MGRVKEHSGPVGVGGKVLLEFQDQRSKKRKKQPTSLSFYSATQPPSHARASHWLNPTRSQKAKYSPEYRLAGQTSPGRNQEQNRLENGS